LKVTKTELVDAIASKAGMTKAEAGRSLDAALDGIRDALARGEKVTVTGFGTFELSKRVKVSRMRFDGNGGSFAF